MSSKKIALVLSGGSTHGFAQLGALKILEEKGIKPDLIVGSSVGALLATAMASGKSIKEIESAIMKETIISFLKPNLNIRNGGLIKADNIVKFILKTLNVKKFEELKTPLIVNASNLLTGKEVIFDNGNLEIALSASISVPGIFTAVKHNSTILVDGAFYDPAPIHLAKDVDVIILIDVSAVDFEVNEKSSTLTILTQSIANLQQRVIEFNIQNTSKDKQIIVIKPNVVKYSLMEVKKRKHLEMIKIGEDEAKKVLSSEQVRRILGI